MTDLKETSVSSDASKEGESLTDVGEIGPVLSEEETLMEFERLCRTVNTRMDNPSLVRFRRQVQVMRSRFEGDKPIMLLLRMMLSLAEHLRKRQADAHPEALPLFRSVRDDFFSLVESPGLSPRTRNALVKSQVDRFQDVQKSIRSLQEPALSEEFAPRDRLVDDDVAPFPVGEESGYEESPSTDEVPVGFEALDADEDLEEAFTDEEVERLPSPEELALGLRSSPEEPGEGYSDTEREQATGSGMEADESEMESASPEELMRELDALSVHESQSVESDSAFFWEDESSDEEGEASDVEPDVLSMDSPGRPDTAVPFELADLREVPDVSGEGAAGPWSKAESLEFSEEGPERLPESAEGLALFKEMRIETDRKIDAVHAELSAMREILDRIERRLDRAEDASLPGDPKAARLEQESVFVAELSGGTAVGGSQAVMPLRESEIEEVSHPLETDRGERGFEGALEVEEDASGRTHDETPSEEGPGEPEQEPDFEFQDGDELRDEYEADEEGAFRRFPGDGLQAPPWVKVVLDGKTYALPEENVLRLGRVNNKTRKRLLKKRPVSFHETLGLFESPKKNLMPAHAHLSKKELESLSFGSLNEKLDSQSVESTGEGMLLLINGHLTGALITDKVPERISPEEGWNLERLDVTELLSEG